MQREFSAKSTKKGMDVLIDNDKGAPNSSIMTVEHKNTIVVDISIKSILLVLGTIAAIYFGSRLLEVITLLFFAFILSSSALPIIKWLVNRRVNKGVAIFLVYLLFILFFFGTLTLIFVPFANEFRNLIVNLPTYLETSVKNLSNLNIFGFTFDPNSLKQASDGIVNWLSSFVASGQGTDGVKGALSTVFSVAGGFISIITMMFMSVYMVVDHDNFVDLVLLRIIDEQKRIRVRRLFYDVEEKLGNWLIGQLILCFIIGILTYILLKIANVPFALPLAVLAGLLEAIPNIGPIIASIPATLFALIVGGPASGLIVLVGFIIIQQLENSIIVPRVMSNAVGLKPIVVVIAVASGFTLGGPIGALVSIPIVVLGEVFYQFYLDLQKLEAKGIV